MWCARNEQWVARICVQVFLICGASAVADVTCAQTLGELARTNGCSTQGAGGISSQLVKFHQCAYPDAVVSYTPHEGIELTSSRVHSLATVETKNALHQAANSLTLRINSGFRPLSDQFVLYKSGACGAAAKPGSSNHQSGKAVDLANWSEARSTLLNVGCSHPLPSSDPVHFDCPGPDIRQQSVLVFQKLWNINHPQDRIEEDGVYGPQTESRLTNTPASGFANTGCMEMLDAVAWSAVLVDSSLDAGSTTSFAPEETKVLTIELRNMGTQSWDERVALRLSEPRDRESRFVGSDWENESTPRKVQGTVAPGETFVFTFTLEAPLEPGVYDETFALAVEDGPWFSEQGGPADNALLFRIRVSDSATATATTTTRPTSADGCTIRRSRTSYSDCWFVFLLIGGLLQRTTNRWPTR